MVKNTITTTSPVPKVNIFNIIKLFILSSIHVESGTNLAYYIIGYLFCDFSYKKQYLFA